jgi:predicted nuclease of predicted toxin-antitoxin system
MLILLDECVNPRAREAFPDHAVEAVQGSAMAGTFDGPLLRYASGRCDVFVTRDKQLPFQQNLSRLPFGIVIAVVADNRIESFRPTFNALNRAVKSVGPGEVVWVEDPERI